MATILFEDSTPLRILVVDDNPSVHEAFDEMLRPEVANERLERDEALIFGGGGERRAGRPVCRTEHALSGAEGVEKARQAMAAGVPYQIAFVDIRMPGMDGVETIERIWAVDSWVQTVICTAYADYQWDDLARRLGRTDRLLVLKKPFHEIEVLQLASTLAHKWILARQAAMKMEQAEQLVARRTEALLEFQRREHARLQELDQTKVRHLTRLAQAFRGPLTIMLHALAEVSAGPVADQSLRDALVGQAGSLLTLVDDALLLRQIEPDERPPEWRELELVAFARGMARMFAASGGERGVDIRFTAAEPHRLIWTDSVQLEKALFHLFARAVAAASRGSAVRVELDCEGEDVRLQWLVPRLDGGGSPSPDEEIGWLLSREILRRLGGELIAPDAGPAGGPAPAFTMAVRLPGTRPAPVAGVTITAGPAAAAAPVEREVPVVLVIEAGADLRGIIRQGLDGAFSVVEAETSAAGLALAREQVPDLVVVGADAAHRDAVELCAELKQGEMTSHIPVILLATDHSEAYQVRALAAGVNEVLVQPFRLPLLKARADNLLANRRKLHAHFQHLQTLQPRELATNRLDAEFLRRVVETVEKNLTDCEFDVEKLARELAVSRRQLFRKFNGIVGCTPNVFIRDLRLKRAAQLLRESGLTVSEIIYAVGFSDPKHFRAIFRERFGVLPGEYGQTLPSAPPPRPL